MGCMEFPNMEKTVCSSCFPEFPKIWGGRLNAHGLRHHVCCFQIVHSPKLGNPNRKINASISSSSKYRTTASRNFLHCPFGVGYHDPPFLVIFYFISLLEFVFFMNSFRDCRFKFC
ncbi:hypothetical protein Nepgr_005726 [Nepenthes gracilis]|uniref:Uncharacterized protein n=1 Tax=Nepenthes gracilis TaxID=150966 RepID=A0AAD3S456_NEPGR|nr:hypothetical protein Nepgr_005726 [Nepenthes gracilis]